MLLVSACLAGEPCRYDGKDNLVPALEELAARGEAIPVCPEVLGGLPTPRIPSERLPDGRVVNAEGEDVTEAFRRGAERALSLCRAHGCSRAVLKARSPSCGKGIIYDGTFSHTCVPGDGIFAALLRAEGIPVRTEEEFAAETMEGE